MSHQAHHLERYNEHIPQNYREAGWRVLIVASGTDTAGVAAYVAVLQNDETPQPNGYFSTLGRSPDEAVNNAIQHLTQHIRLDSGGGAARRA